MRTILLLVLAALALAGCNTSAKIRAKETRMMDARLSLREIKERRNLGKEALDAACEDPGFAAAIRRRSDAKRDGARVVSPKPIPPVAVPDYPRSMRGDFREAIVHFAFIVTEAGDVTEARYVPLEGLDVPAPFIEAARKAVKSWRFEPGRIDGRPEAFALVRPLSFTLKLSVPLPLAPTVR